MFGEENSTTTVWPLPRSEWPNSSLRRCASDSAQAMNASRRTEKLTYGPCGDAPAINSPGWTFAASSRATSAGFFFCARARAKQGNA